MTAKLGFCVSLVSPLRVPEGLDMSKEMVLGTMNDLPKPGVAAVLSFVIPGLGQFYNGKFLRGLFWLIITPGLWLTTAGLLGWVCHILSAYTAYAFAQRLRR